MRRSLCSAICFVLLFATELFAQDVVVRGRFLADSLRVGDEVFYALSVRYPAQQQVIFPDTSHFYGPFEFIRKRFFVTETKNGISFDSAVYHLTTFETDSLLRLRLPVFRINALDCTRYHTAWDTIRMQLMVKVMPEKIGPDLPLRATIAYQNVPKSFNFPVAFVLTGMTLLLAATVWLIFGDRFRKRYQEKRLRKAHLQFIGRYTKEVENIRKDFSPQKAEAALLIWKQYMEKLNRRPYTKLTTKETLALEKDQLLAVGLRSVDRAVYGTDTDVVDPLNTLKGYADQKFEQKLREVRNEQ